ncbi:ArnT family glycosyltransferase [Jeongeupia chitinilytica]|uniref:Glycosyltransferase RgtA/B/C/D-like domain-containing protein n=1 Tax=Jeongeupia chitinilytica TaxID=1041641 RepID=A0ABQ3GWP9_9NEIS|nr:hypothetical protein [Jeongeupia chitinilytica]GHD57228.1 hypothetical protein GCM10007350_05600 [Jeongeupia chitinilytica]
MLTYLPPSERETPPPPSDKPWLLLLLCVFWVFPGLVGHDPWKPGELETAAVIGRFLSGQHWSLPFFGEQPYLIAGPLYYWSAALLAWPLGKLGLAVHDAARLITGVWTALAMWGVGLAGRELFGRRQGRVCVMVLIGSIGLVVWGHHLAPPILTLTAFAWLAYALAYARRQPLLAGLLLGLVWLVLIAGSNLGQLGLAVLMAVVVGALGPWRRSAYLVTLLAALVIAIPVGAIWLIDLVRYDPAAFAQWLRLFAFGPYDGIGSSAWLGTAGYVLAVVPWFAWPALPLACWGIWSNRAELGSQPKLLLPLIMAGLGLLWLLLAGDVRESDLLVLLPSLSLLAGAGIDSLRRGAAAALNWFGVMTFGIGAALLWLGWLILHLGAPASWGNALQAASPAYEPSWHFGGLLSAAAISALWCWVLVRKRPLGRLAVTNWACGVTLLWGVLIGLWQPWLDASKSYRDVVMSLRQALDQQVPPGCIAGEVSTSMLASLDYFAGIRLRSGPAAAECSLVLRQGTPPVGSWIRWEGQRAGESRERFYLIQLPEGGGE